MRTGETSFDPVAFGRAIETGNVDDQLTRYADNAQLQVGDVDPSNLAQRPLLQLVGALAIGAWLTTRASDTAGRRIVTLVVSADHIVFIERSCRRDGRSMLSTSAAELRDGLITFQHTNLRSDDPPHAGAESNRQRPIRNLISRRHLRGA